jgi:hypothetical protein
MWKYVVRCSMLLLLSTGCGSPAPSASAVKRSRADVPDSNRETSIAQYASIHPNNAQDSRAVAAARVARAALDSQMQAAPGQVILVAGLADSTITRVTTPDKWPDSTVVSYDIFADHAGYVRLAYESPYSQSGDWSLVISHYFDTRGLTFLVERQMSFFNGCWNDSTANMIPVRETSTTYFDSTGRLISREFVRTTFDDKPAPTEGCNTTMRTPYAVYLSWDSLAACRRLGQFMPAPSH